MRFRAKFKMKNEELKSKNRQLRIIINADDYGLSKNFNKGIIYCFRKKLITSTTVLINKPCVDEKPITKIKNLSMGLHLEFKDINIKNTKTIKRIINQQYKEFLKRFDKKPSHIDGHKGCLVVNPKILTEVLKLAKKEGFAVRSDQLLQNKKIKSAGIKTTDSGLIWITYRKPIEIMNDLNKLREGTYELICHPGYYDPKSDSSLNKERENDIKFLESNGFQNWIKEKRVELINYNQL